jgi:hypothetical protein
MGRMSEPAPATVTPRSGFAPNANPSELQRVNASKMTATVALIEIAASFASFRIESTSITD